MPLSPNLFYPCFPFSQNFISQISRVCSILRITFKDYILFYSNQGLTQDGHTNWDALCRIQIHDLMCIKLYGPLDHPPVNSLVQGQTALICNLFASLIFPHSETPISIYQTLCCSIYFKHFFIKSSTRGSIMH
jgi:hypothetical protein